MKILVLQYQDIVEYFHISKQKYVLLLPMYGMDHLKVRSI